MPDAVMTSQKLAKIAALTVMFSKAFKQWFWTNKEHKLTEKQTLLKKKSTPINRPLDASLLVVPFIQNSILREFFFFFLLFFFFKVGPAVANVWKFWPEVLVRLLVFLLAIAADVQSGIWWRGHCVGLSVWGRHQPRHQHPQTHGKICLVW